MSDCWCGQDRHAQLSLSTTGYCPHFLKIASIVPAARPHARHPYATHSTCLQRAEMQGLTPNNGLACHTRSRQFAAPVPLALRQPAGARHSQRQHTVARASSVSIPDRLASFGPYLLPLLDGLRYGTLSLLGLVCFLGAWHCVLFCPAHGIP